MFSINHVVTVKVEIPALDGLVAYLTGAQQKQVDDLAASLNAAVAKLQRSNSRLHDASQKVQGA